MPKCVVLLQLPIFALDLRSMLRGNIRRVNAANSMCGHSLDPNEPYPPSTMFKAIRNILSTTLSTQDSSRDRNPASDPHVCASSTDTRPSDEWLATWGYPNDAQPGEEWEWLDAPSSRPSPSMLSIGSARIITPLLLPLDEPLPLLSAITPSGLEVALERHAWATEGEAAAAASDGKLRCAVRACSRRIGTWKWRRHHCRSCGRFVCSRCACHSVYDALDVDGEEKRTPKRGMSRVVRR